MKYRAKEAMCNMSGNQLVTIGKIYDIEKVNTVIKYRFINNLSHEHYISEELLNKYFEKVEEGMKFKVGDTVRIRKDLQTKKYYGKNSVTDEMLKYLGKSANIVGVTPQQEYSLDIDNRYWGWTDEMLEPVQSLSFDVNKYIGKAIHCDTEEKANKLLAYLDGQGYKWRAGNSLLAINYWGTNRENTYYELLKNKRIAFLNERGCDYKVEFEDLLKEDKPVMCKIVGREIGEEFIIKDYLGNPCYINRLGEVRNSQGECVRASVLTRAVNHPEYIQDVPTEPLYTDKQLEVFKMLKDVFHLNFIARDGNAFDNDLFGYVGKPVRRDGDDAWDLQPTMVELSLLDKDIFDFIKWDDKEPFDLAKALEIGK